MGKMSIRYIIYVLQLGCSSSAKQLLKCGFVEGWAAEALGVVERG